ncbi:MAG: hypothetical protein WCO94_10500 [Verrucomicrobiota bacterium]
MRNPATQWEIEAPQGMFGRPVGPRELVRIIFSSSLIVAVFLAVGLFVSWKMFESAPRAYVATGTFVVDELPFVQTLQQPDAETDRQLVQTVILSIANRDMRSAVEARLGLPAGRISFAGIDRPLKLQGREPEANVEVASVKNSRMGSISADSQSAEFAAKVVNAILEELQLYNIVGGRLKAIQTSSKFLKSKSESLLQQLVDVSAQRAKLEGQRTEMENYLKQQLPLYAFPAFSQDATMNNLRTQLILVESEYKALAATSTRGQRLEGKAEELRTLRDQLTKQAGNLAEALRADYTIRSAQEQNLQVDQRNGALRLDELTRESTRLAQSFGDPTLMRKLAAEKQDAGTGPANMIVPVDLAYPPVRPSRPKLVFYLLLGGAFGGLVGLGLAAINVLLDTSLKSAEQIETQLGLPCLAVLQKRPQLARGAAPENADHSPGLGFLRSHLLSLSQSGITRVIGFSPVSSRQRSSALVADLAVLLARSGKRTLVVDLHFDAPRIAKSLGVEVKGGIEKWLQSDGPLGGFVGMSSISGLAVLSASRRNAGLADQLSRRPLAAEWAAISADWDFVLIDSPCLLADWSLNLALPAGSPLILTADFRRTKLDMLRQACSHARGPRWEVEGVVLTNAPRRIAA